jgi:hypothetical protein
MRFEYEDDASAEALAKEDLVADFGVGSVERLRRETSTSSVESLSRTLRRVAFMAELHLNR